jgi:hypothetical protein
MRMPLFAARMVLICTLPVLAWGQANPPAKAKVNPKTDTARPGTPSLKDTTDWLAGNLNAWISVAYKKEFPTNGFGWTAVNTDTFSHIQSASSLTFQGCTGTIQIAINDNHAHVAESTFSGPNDAGKTTTQTISKSEQYSGTVTFSLKELALPVRTAPWRDFVGVGAPTDVSQPPKSLVTLPAHGTMTKRLVYDYTDIGDLNFVPQHKDEQTQWQPGALQFYFYDEELAVRVMRALNHVGELCGAKKSPF